MRKREDPALLFASCRTADPVVVCLLQDCGSCLKTEQIGSDLSSVADPGCLSRIRIFSIPDPGSRVKKIPGSGSASKNLSILTQKMFLSWVVSSGKYDPGCSSRIRILNFYQSRIQGSKKSPDRQHCVLYLPVNIKLLTILVCWLLFWSGCEKHQLDTAVSVHFFARCTNI